MSGLDLHSRESSLRGRNPVDGLQDEGSIGGHACSAAALEQIRCGNPGKVAQHLSYAAAAESLVRSIFGARIHYLAGTEERMTREAPVQP
jgi:hypothetical protein